MMDTPFDHHRGLSCVCFGDPDECGCPDGEVAVRHYAKGLPMPPMTPQQQCWCLREIGSVEGFRGSDYLTSSDQGLAKALLEAWLEYARDKGLA
jgi:hypothetical protein